jgi:hypothetical protein
VIAKAESRWIRCRCADQSYAAAFRAVGAAGNIRSEPLIKGRSVLEANPEPTRPSARRMCLPTLGGFTIGVADAGGHHIAESGELGFARDITCMPKHLFA